MTDDVAAFTDDLQRELRAQKASLLDADFLAEVEAHAELSAYGLSVESPNAEYCTRMFHALRDGYGFSEEELTWFSMHAALDAAHGSEFRRHLARAAEAPDGLARVRQLTLAMSPMVKHVWDGFGAWRTAT